MVNKSQLPSDLDVFARDILYRIDHGQALPPIETAMVLSELARGSGRTATLARVHLKRLLEGRAVTSADVGSVVRDGRGGWGDDTFAEILGIDPKEAGLWISVLGESMGGEYWARGALFVVGPVLREQSDPWRWLAVMALCSRSPWYGWAKQEPPPAMAARSLMINPGSRRARIYRNGYRDALTDESIDERARAMRALRDRLAMRAA